MPRKYFFEGGNFLQNTFKDRQAELQVCKDKYVTHRPNRFRKFQRYILAGNSFFQVLFPTSCILTWNPFSSKIQKSSEILSEKTLPYIYIYI